MQALLGKIVAIKPLGEATVAGRAGMRVEISFTGLCVLPERTAIPEWLKEQTLKIIREVYDLREVGHAGDSLAFTVAESAHWLFPLAVTPVYYDVLPERLDIFLRWWKDGKPPEVMVRANGQQWSGSFAKEGDRFVASVETKLFYPTPPPSLPVKFEVTCGKLHLESHVLPTDRPVGEKMLGESGEMLRLRNAWYEIDLTATRGGGISALNENGRGNNHFLPPTDMIQQPLESAGHRDELRIGWGRKLGDVAMTCAGIRREGCTTRVLMEGVVDEGMGLHTSVNYTIFDELPLIFLQREFAMHSGKKADKSEGPEKPKEIIDQLFSMSASFRAAWVAERDGQCGSRILCVEGERLAPYRLVRPHSNNSQSGWRLRDGWAMVEHPRRREYMLYLFDGHTPPSLASWMDMTSFTLEPRWPSAPMMTGNSLGFTLAISAGEIGGAAVEGCWVACRARYHGGVRCAVIGTFRATGEMTAQVTLGGTMREEPLASTLLPGVGTFWHTVLQYPDGSMTDDFSATVAGIAGRRHEHESI